MANVVKRGNSYRITVSTGYNSEGKQVRRSMTWNPEEKMTEKQIEKELQRQVVNFERQCKNGGINVNNIKLCDFIPQYLNTKKTILSPASYIGYKNVIEKIINPALGHMKLKEVRPVHIQKFISDLENIKKEDGNLLSPSTVKRHFTILKSIFALAYKLELTDINPTDNTRLVLPKIKEVPTSIFTPEEVQNILRLVSSEPLQWQVLLNMAINTGCRRGELVALQWQDINFNKNTVKVSESAYKIKGQNVTNKETKTGKTRIITIPIYLTELLREYKHAQNLEQLRLGRAWRGNNYIFTQADGAEMYPTTPTNWFDKFQKRNNLPHRKFHALRHTSATLLLSCGVDIKTVGKRLGHSQLSTTNRYVHALESADKAAADKLENMFDNTKSI